MITGTKPSGRPTASEMIQSFCGSQPTNSCEKLQRSSHMALANSPTNPRNPPARNWTSFLLEAVSSDTPPSTPPKPRMTIRRTTHPGSNFHQPPILARPSIAMPTTRASSSVFRIRSRNRSGPAGDAARRLRQAATASTMPSSREVVLCHPKSARALAGEAAHH